MIIIIQSFSNLVFELTHPALPDIMVNVFELISWYFIYSIFKTILFISLWGMLIKTQTNLIVRKELSGVCQFL